MEKQEIFEKIKAALAEDFDIEEEKLVPEAKLPAGRRLPDGNQVDDPVRILGTAKKPVQACQTS